MLKEAEKYYYNSMQKSREFTRNRVIVPSQIIECINFALFFKNCNIQNLYDIRLTNTETNLTNSCSFSASIAEGRS